jgi:hypothetical protein
MCIIGIEQNIFPIFLLWTFACISGLNPLLMIGFKFQLLPMQERFLVHSIIKYIHNHTVHLRVNVLVLLIQMCECKVGHMTNYTESEIAFLHTLSNIENCAKCCTNVLHDEPFVDINEVIFMFHVK